ncbi:hypothetical protein TKK_0015697 [Trichogramma kaykai]
MRPASKTRRATTWLLVSILSTSRADHRSRSCREDEAGFKDSMSYDVVTRVDELRLVHEESKTRKDLSCPAIACVNSLEHLKEQPVHREWEHFDKPDHLLLLREQFSKELVDSAATSSSSKEKKLKEIYDRVRAKPEYAPLIGQVSFYETNKERMRRSQSKNKPKIPKSLSKLGNRLTEYEPTQHLFKGKIKNEQKEVALIFIHNDMLAPLNLRNHLFVDGTFNMRSLIPGFRQVYIVHFRKFDTGFAAIFIFTSSQTKTMYNSIWEKIFELVPKLQKNVTTIMCNFEKAQIHSLKKNFPKARTCGCLFHYKMAIIKKWDKLEIVENEHILEKTYALAHLLPTKMQEGINYITGLIDEVDDNQKLQMFGKYLRTQWLPLKDVFSVFQNPVRTNNTCENFHLHATNRIGKHSTIWKMLDELSKVMQDVVLNFLTVQKGGRFKKFIRPKDLQVTDGYIHDYEKKFNNDRYSVEEFLTLIANLNRLDLSRECPSCSSTIKVQKLRPCEHKLCYQCIQDLYKRECPFCQVFIASYTGNEEITGKENWTQQEIRIFEQE